MGWSEIYLIPTKPLSLSLSLSLFFKVKNLKCLLTTIWSWMMDAVADFPLSLSVFLTRCDILFGKITKAKLPFTFIQSKKKKKDYKSKTEQNHLPHLEVLSYSPPSHQLQYVTCDFKKKTLKIVIGKI